MPYLVGNTRDFLKLKKKTKMIFIIVPSLLASAIKHETCIQSVADNWKNKGFKK